MRRDFYDYIEEITEGMHAGLVKIRTQEPESSHRWEVILREARENGGQSVL